MVEERRLVKYLGKVLDDPYTMRTDGDWGEGEDMTFYIYNDKATVAICYVAFKNCTEEDGKYFADVSFMDFGYQDQYMLREERLHTEITTVTQIREILKETKDIFCL